MDTDDNFAISFAKIRTKVTLDLEESMADLAANCDLFIDIFPFENAFYNILLCKLFEFTTYMLEKNIDYKLGYDFYIDKNVTNGFVYELIIILASLMSA